ncbi:hypothetical protein R3I94_006077 [Phoxinus phoxinus]
MHGSFENPGDHRRNQ